MSGFHKEERRALVESTTLPEVGTSEESIPRAVVPWSKDDDRSRYLGLRASGFTIREALSLIGKAKSTLSAWRQDQTFLELENGVPELKKTLAMEYASLEFLRNYRLILEKDFRVLKGSLNRPRVLGDNGNWYTTPQDQQDYQYLLRLRAHYTPQQLQAIEQLFSKDDSGREFNWQDFVLTMSRTKEEVRVETRHRQPATLSPIIDAEVCDEVSEVREGSKEAGS